MERRQFLTAVSAAAIAAPAIVRGQNLNSNLQLAAIGTGGKGWSDTKEMATHDKVRHVAFCDVDTQRALNAQKLQPDAPVFQDYREMLDSMEGKIDAVTVSTPDHMHAYLTLDAMRRGLHVYCQKPLTHNVWEARQVAKQAKQSGVITRLGNQIHSHQHYRTAVQAIQSGMIGKVTAVHSWVSAPGHGRSGYLGRPPENEPVPKTIDWDLWVGVAPMRPFGKLGVYHSFGWRDFQDFGGGAIGDFTCHILDPVFTALGIQNAPTRIQADHIGLNKEVWSAQNTVFYDFAGTDYTADESLRITWYDGGRQPSKKGTHVPDERALPSSGSLFVGETGSLVLPHVGAMRAYPEADFAETDIEVVPSLNHYHGWVDGALSGENPSDGFAYGAVLTETALLGNVATHFRKENLDWDEAAMSFSNRPEANAFLKRDYREGWEIAEV